MAAIRLTAASPMKKARDHLFEALGLAIAAELVRAHGGEIHLVEGTIGATFRVAIPDRPVELLSVRSRLQAATST
jgi:nitrogen-specific signal transduction histidine kinase